MAKDQVDVMQRIDDKIVGAVASRELTKKISNSKLYIYEDYGHTVYEEARDFNARILHFLRR